MILLFLNIRFFVNNADYPLAMYGQLPYDMKVVFERGRSLTDFIVASAAESARRVIRERELIDLSRRDRKAFVASLLNPPSPNRRLRDAARYYDQVMGKR
jgi:hypothetical protein